MRRRLRRALKMAPPGFWSLQLREKQARVYHNDGIKVEVVVGHKDAHKAAATSGAALYCFQLVHEKKCGDVPERVLRCASADAPPHARAP